jgi:hypothetical protein
VSGEAALTDEDLVAAGVWRGPSDDWADVETTVDDDQVTLLLRFPVFLRDDEQSVQPLTAALTRRLLFVYRGGLEQRVPDVLTSGRQLAVVLMLLEQVLPAAAEHALQEWAATFAAQGIGFTVLLLPAGDFTRG